MKLRAVRRVMVCEQEFPWRAVIERVVSAHWKDHLDRIVAFDPGNDDHLLIFDNPQRDEKPCTIVERAKIRRRFVNETFPFAKNRSRQFPNSRAELILVGTFAGL
jgi:hypothetical protein